MNISSCSVVKQAEHKTIDTTDKLLLTNADRKLSNGDTHYISRTCKTTNHRKRFSECLRLCSARGGRRDSFSTYMLDSPTTTTIPTTSDANVHNFITYTDSKCKSVNEDITSAHNTVNSNSVNSISFNQINGSQIYTGFHGDLLKPPHQMTHREIQSELHLSGEIPILMNSRLSKLPTSISSHFSGSTLPSTTTTAVKTTGSPKGNKFSSNKILTDCIKDLNVVNTRNLNETVAASILQRCQTVLEGLIDKASTIQHKMVKQAKLLKICNTNLESEYSNECLKNRNDFQSVISNKLNNGKLDEQIYFITRKIHDLQCQLESFNYLSWLNLTPLPDTCKVISPGLNAPKPNPQLHLIRRSDADTRRTIQEFRQYCDAPIPQNVLDELRTIDFNNWTRSDAYLIRLLREMFVELHFVENYNLQLHTLDLWLIDVYRRYNRVPFHNFKHAFMVAQMCYVILWNANLVHILDEDDQLILLVATICHDLDHPGFNNAYQINAGTELALRYNDQSPLENHHTAMAFEILSHIESNPFRHLNSNTRQRIREGIIRCILATDMSRHNDILEEFTDLILSDLENACKLDPVTNKPAWCLNRAQCDLVLIMLIKICDISNEARPLHVAGPWINRLLSEFFHQSDYEKLVGIPVAPFMDRDKVTKPASQCGFIRFVLLPLFESMAKLLPVLQECRKLVRGIGT